jgi:hypothetical protein
MYALKKLTTYPDTISWAAKAFAKMCTEHNDEVIINVYNKATMERIGTTTVGECKNSFKETFTKGGKFKFTKKIVVANFRRL